MEEENVLGKQQQETLDSNYKKYDILENIIQEGDIKNIGRHYKVNLADDWSASMVHKTAPEIVLPSLCKLVLFSV